METRYNQKNYRLLFFVVAMFSYISMDAVSIKNPTWLHATGLHVDVTGIEYNRKSTKVQFVTSRRLEQPLLIRKNIYIVGDDGMRHHAVRATDIELGKEYTLLHGQSMSFSIEFEPVGTSNTVLDVRAPGQFAIYGLHEQGAQLVIPKAEGSINSSESDYSLFEMRDVEIEGTLHDPDKELGDVVQVNYIAPLNQPNQRGTQSAKVDADGHFSMKFPMYAPQLMFFLQPYKHGIVANGVYARPGDKLFVELNDPYITTAVSLKNDADRETYAKLTYLPSYGFNTDKYLKNLNQNHRFAVLSYQEQHDEIMEEYRRGLDFANYVCWHYCLTPYEAAIYIAGIHANYIQWLLMTDGGAFYETESAYSFVRQQYSDIVSKMDYSYLRNIDADSPLLAIIPQMEMLPELVYQTALMSQCVEQVPVDTPDRLQKVINLQKDALERVVGWKGQTLMLELLMVQDMFRMEGFTINDDSEAQTLRQMLHHPYSQTCFDLYYRKQSVK